MRAEAREGELNFGTAATLPSPASNAETGITPLEASFKGVSSPSVITACELLSRLSHNPFHTFSRYFLHSPYNPDAGKWSTRHAQGVRQEAHLEAEEGGDGGSRVSE